MLKVQQFTVMDYWPEACGRGINIPYRAPAFEMAEGSCRLFQQNKRKNVGRLLVLDDWCRRGGARLISSRWISNANGVLIVTANGTPQHTKITCSQLPIQTIFEVVIDRVPPTRIVQRCKTISGKIFPGGGSRF